MVMLLRITPLVRAAQPCLTFSGRCAMSTFALSRSAVPTSTSRFGNSKIGSMMKPQLAGISARRGIMYPALLGRRLGDILDLPRLHQQLEEDEKNGLPNIAEDLWMTHHATLDDAIGGSIPGSELESFREFTEKNPIFVFPVTKNGGKAEEDKGKYYVMYGQWVGDMAMFTYLDDKRNNPETAEPRMSIHLYADSLSFSPKVFIRCDISPLIPKDEAIYLWEKVLFFYNGEGRQDVEYFNHDLSKFEFKRVFKEHVDF